MAGEEVVVPQTLSLLRIYKGFAITTSMHGIGRTVDNRHPLRRFLWILLVAVAFAAGVYQFVVTIDDFYSYPVTTAVNVRQETKSMFPGITICNLNRKRKSKIQPKLLDLLTNFTEVTYVFVIVYGYLSVYLSVYMSVCPSVCLSDCMSNCRVGAYSTIKRVHQMADSGVAFRYTGCSK